MVKIHKMYFLASNEVLQNLFVRQYHPEKYLPIDCCPSEKNVNYKDLKPLDAFTWQRREVYSTSSVLEGNQSTTL